MTMYSSIQRQHIYNATGHLACNRCGWLTPGWSPTIAHNPLVDARPTIVWFCTGCGYRQGIFRPVANKDYELQKSQSPKLKKKTIKTSYGVFTKTTCGKQVVSATYTPDAALQESLAKDSPSTANSAEKSTHNTFPNGRWG
jgi:ribosomal protein L37AE/L43A